MRVSALPNGVSIDTGRLQVTLATGAALFERVAAGDRVIVDAARTAISARDERGEPCAVAIERLTIEESSALRAVVRADGVVRAPAGRVLVELSIRLHFFGDSPTVRMQVRVRNSRPAQHADGFWDLGDPGSVYLRDLSLTIALNAADGPAEVTCSPEIGSPVEAVSLPFSLYQDSSGGENWKSPNHLNRERVVPISLPRISDALRC